MANALTRIDVNTFELVVGETTHRVFFSFGIDTELLRIFTDYMTKLYRSNTEMGSAANLDTFRAEITDRLASIDENDVDKLEEVVSELILRSDSEKENRLSAIISTLGNSMVDMNNCFAQVMSLLLTKRDNYGTIVTPVTVGEIMYSPVYSDPEVNKVLKELFDVCFERYQKALEEGAAFRKKSVGAVGQ